MFTSIGSAVVSEHVHATRSCMFAVQPPAGSVSVTTGAVVPVPPIDFPRRAATSGELDGVAAQVPVNARTAPKQTQATGMEALGRVGEVPISIAPWSPPPV